MKIEGSAGCLLFRWMHFRLNRFLQATIMIGMLGEARVHVSPSQRMGVNGLVGGAGSGDWWVGVREGRCWYTIPVYRNYGPSAGRPLFFTGMLRFVI